MKKITFYLFTLLISTLSFGQTPTLYILDGPTNGSTFIGDPETVSGGNADVDFNTTSFIMCSDVSGTTPSGCNGYIKWSVENIVGPTYVDGGNIFTSNDTNTVYPIMGIVNGETYFLRAELVDTNGDPLSTPVVYSFTVTIASYIDVDNLADLRTNSVSDDLYYRVTGSVTNTFS